MIHIVLDSEDRSAVIDYLETRNAYLCEKDGTICKDPHCRTIEHLIVFKHSILVTHSADIREYINKDRFSWIPAYEKAVEESKEFLQAEELWKDGRKLVPYQFDKGDSDVLYFMSGLPNKEGTTYGRGRLAFLHPTRMDGTRKPDWLQEEYKLLMRFIKKRTVKYFDGVLYNYLSPSIEEKRQQGILEITN